MRTIEFESAQNVRVEYELSTVGSRIVAMIIDTAVFVLYFIICGAVVGYSNLFSNYSGSEMMVQLILLKIPWVFYYPIVEYFTQGQSLGKFAMGIRVVSISGERPGFKEVFIRWLFRGDLLWISPSGLVFLWFAIGLMGVGFAGFSDNRQRLGDVMAGTVVIKNKSSIQYTLKKILLIKTNKNYSATYENAARFTDEDMFLIKSTILRVKKYPNKENKLFAIELANKSADLLGLDETPEKRLKFLETLLQDYIVLTR